MSIAVWVGLVSQPERVLKSGVALAGKHGWNCRPAARQPGGQGKRENGEGRRTWRRARHPNGARNGRDHSREESLHLPDHHNQDSSSLPLAPAKSPAPLPFDPQPNSHLQVGPKAFSNLQTIKRRTSPLLVALLCRWWGAVAAWVGAATRFELAARYFRPSPYYNPDPIFFLTGWCCLKEAMVSTTGHLPLQ